jgi:predicted Zn-dependent protease
MNEPAGGPQELVERALELAKADACTVIVEEHAEVNLRFANNALTTDGAARSQQITVIATNGGAVGTVTARGDVGDDLAALVGAACDQARAGTPAPDAGPPPTGAASTPPGAWHAAVPGTDVRAFGGLIPGLGRAFAAAQSAGQRLYGYAEHRMRSVFLGTSGGLRLRHDQPGGHLEVTGRDGTSSAWAGAATRDFRDVSAEAIHDQLRDRLAVGARRRIDLPPGRYDVLLPPAAVADLMNYVYWNASAQDATEGRTVYSRPDGRTKLGERLTGVPVTLSGDPAAPGLACAPFVLARSSDEMVSVFDNGLPLRRTRWIDEGRLAALVGTRRSAAAAGIPLTPHIDNLTLEVTGGRGSLADLVAGTGRGLLVTSLWYIREVDPRTLLMTGLTRDGVYLVEDGEIVGAVNNFRFNETPVGILARITGAGHSVPTRPREWGDAFTATAMPTLRVSDFNMSSVSAAT